MARKTRDACFSKRRRLKAKSEAKTTKRHSPPKRALSLWLTRPICRARVFGMSSARGVFSGAVPRVWHGTPPHRGRRGVTRGAASRAAATPNDASSNLGTDSGKTSASPSSANAFSAVPHSGYHRQVGFKRSFFEGWYFRVTLPDVRDNLSLIYHVYDPDLPESSRRVAGAQVCTPGGGTYFPFTTFCLPVYSPSLTSTH